MGQSNSQLNKHNSYLEQLFYNNLINVDINKINVSNVNLNNTYFDIPYSHWIVLCSLKYSNEKYYQLLKLINLNYCNKFNKAFKLKLNVYKTKSEILINNHIYNYLLIHSTNITNLCYYLKYKIKKNHNFITFMGLSKNMIQKYETQVIINLNMLISKLNKNNIIPKFLKPTAPPSYLLKT